MNELVRFDLDDGGSVLVAVASSDPGISRATRAGDAIKTAATSFESAMGGVRDAAVSALRRFRDIPQPPDEITIELGVEFEAQAGAVIAQTSAAAHLQVTLVWRRSQTQDPPVHEAPKQAN
jgi:Trypsin-co-occurring domain 1